MKLKAAVLGGVGVAALVGLTAIYTQQRSHASLGGVSAGHAAQVAWNGTHKVQVQDPAYGMTAFTVDVPTGWKFAGAILRPGGCHPPPTPSSGLSYTSESPDGVTAYVMLPGVSWTWTSNGSNMQGPKCPSNININTAAGLLLNIAVPNLHPRATSVVVVPLAQKLQDAIASNNAQSAAQVGSYGMQMRQFQDAAQVRVEYERNGQQIEEMEFTVIDCLETRVPPTRAMPYARMPGQPGYTKRSCSSRGTGITRAPKGHLDGALAHKPAFQQIDKEWDERVIHDMTTSFQQMQAASDRAFQASMANFKAQGEQRLEQGRQFQAQMQASTNASMQRAADSQAAIDHAAHQSALYSLDRQTFVNPATGQRIEASNQYNHQWMSSDGNTMVQTQDPTFDPNGVVYPVSQSWTELVPAN